jgi:3-oxoacyl-[acyl-carrier protein] reductase
LNKKKVFITGSSRGIGLKIAEKFLSEGYNIIAPKRNELDLSDLNSVKKYLENFNEEVDVLINNAGINNLSYSYDFSDSDLVDIMNTNLISCIYIIKKFVPLMMKNNYGRIVNISSIWSVVSKPQRYLYSISKAGLNSLTRSLAVELKNTNILVNSLAPGFVNTELTKKNNTSEQIKEIIKKIPLGRLAEPEEIAEVVFFLGSEKNSYITGQTIIIDGGYTCL